MYKIKQIIQESIDVKQQLLADESLINKIQVTSDQCIQTYQKGGKILFCGNGGSAADAQHIAAELSGRFYKDRKPLYAEALHVNTSYLTAVANDYGYDMIYARMVQMMGKAGDVLIGLSTSGNSNNVVQAMIQSKQLGMSCIAFTGSDGGMLKEIADILINVPSTNTPRIQECHITIGHILCELIETTLFP